MLPVFKITKNMTCFNFILIVFTVILECSCGALGREPQFHQKEACPSSHRDDFADSLIKDIYTTVKKSESSLANPADYPEHYSPQEGEEFDFIVVGAGSAGAVVANRLSEERCWKVLLLEAGGNPTKATEVPGAYLELQDTAIDWQYHTDPEGDNCLAMVNRSCNWPRGKILGGSSTINAMLYVRGNKDDYNGWARRGNYGWDYESVLKYFKKSENLVAEEVLRSKNCKNYHGKGGFLNVSTIKNYGIEGIVQAFSSGMKELGYKTINDCNCKSQMGFAKLQGTMVDGKRCSTAKAFLKTSKSRQNLKVSKHSLVTKILIDKKTKTAYGVKFTDCKGKEINVKAKKEVIVSAGTINSPQLLMLSGIGPKEHLEEFNIDVVADLPVGENLQDHILMFGLVYSYNYSRPVKPLKDYMYDFLTSTSSKLSGLGMTSYYGFINTTDNSSEIPDILICQADFDKNDTISLPSILSKFRISDEISKKYLEINANRYMSIVAPTILKPKSRGKVVLKSADPKDKVKIICGYLTDDRDIETLLRGTEFISKLAKTKGLGTLDTKFHEIVAPACSKHPVSSREFRICSLKHFGTTLYHPSSTCKMGAVEDPTAVVDPELRVKGIQHLRVADCSIMPDITRGNTNAPTIMIGEKASDLIKKTWK